MAVLTRRQTGAVARLARGQLRQRWRTLARGAMRMGGRVLPYAAAAEAGYEGAKWVYSKIKKQKTDQEVNKNVDRIVNPRVVMYKRPRVSKYGKRKWHRKMKYRRRLKKLLFKRYKPFLITVNDPVAAPYFRYDTPPVSSLIGNNQYWMIQGGAGAYPKNFPLGINFGYNAQTAGFRYNGIQLFNDFIRTRQPLIEATSTNTLIQLNNSLLHEQIPMWCKEYREIDFVYNPTSSGDLTLLNVDIYEVVARQTLTGQDDATGLMYQFANSEATTMGTLGAGHTGGANNSNLTPLTTVGDFYSRKGQTPWDLPVFTKYFKIIKKTRFCLAPDVAQTYFMKGKWMRHSIEEAPIIKGKTRMLMVCLAPDNASILGTGTDNVTITICNRHKYRFLNTMSEWKNGAIQACVIST